VCRSFLVLYVLIGSASTTLFCNATSAAREHGLYFLVAYVLLTFAIGSFGVVRVNALGPFSYASLSLAVFL